MDLNQAIQLIDSALSTLQLNREGHIRINVAVKTVMDALQELQQIKTNTGNTKEKEEDAS